MKHTGQSPEIVDELQCGILLSAQFTSFNARVSLGLVSYLRYTANNTSKPCKRQHDLASSVSIIHFEGMNYCKISIYGNANQYHTRQVRTERSMKG